MGTKDTGIEDNRHKVGAKWMWSLEEKTSESALQNEDDPGKTEETANNWLTNSFSTNEDGNIVSHESDP